MHPGNESRAGEFEMPTLILKSLNACNLRCAYCSLGKKEKTKMLSGRQMLDALYLFASRVRNQGEDRASVIFHGGEPMLLPAGQYGKCIEAVSRDFTDIQFRFAMQTNGTLLSQEYLELFQAHSIHIGVSLDGSQPIHDGQRCDVYGNGTYQLVMEHIKILQDHDIPVSALMVLTKPALDSGLEFLQKMDASGIPLKINPLLSLGEAVSHPELALKPGEYGRYLARVFEYLVENQLELHVSPLENLLCAVLAGKTPRGCIYNPHCCREFLCVDQEGMIYPCGRSADDSSNALGTLEYGITENGLHILDMLEARRTNDMPHECRQCRYVSLCNAGCSADRPWRDGIVQPCATCTDQKYIIRYIRTRGIELLSRQLQEERFRLQNTLAEQEALYGI
jgi:uncharacterized protein